MRTKVRRTFVNGAFRARRSPFLSPCNHRLRHDENRVKDQGDAAGWQSYDSEPSHHAEGIKGFSDIDTKYNALLRGTLINRASDDHGCRTDHKDANEGKHSPRDKNSVDDGVSQTVVHAPHAMRFPAGFQACSGAFLPMSYGAILL